MFQKVRFSWLQVLCVLSLWRIFFARELPAALDFAEVCEEWKKKGNLAAKSLDRRVKKKKVKNAK